MVRRGGRRNSSYWSILYVQGASVAFERPQIWSHCDCLPIAYVLDAMPVDLGLRDIDTALPLAALNYGFSTDILESLQTGIRHGTASG